MSVTPSTSPLTSWSGPPGTAAMTKRSRRPDTGSAPNITPPASGTRKGCTSTAMRPAPGRPSCTASPLATTTRTASTKRVPAAHVEDRLEATGHRRVDAVLDRGRRTHDERPDAVIGQVTPGLANCVDGRHALVLDDRNRGVGREHEAREHGKAGLVGASERRRLGAGALGLGRIRERHDGQLGTRLRVSAHHRKFLSHAAATAA